MKLFANVVYIFFIVIIFSSGCKSVRFEYPNARCKIEKWDIDNVPTVEILPLVDLRDDKSSTEGWSMLSNLPFIPCVPFHNYDLQGYNADVGEFDFNMKKEVMDAFVKHMKMSGIAQVRRVSGERKTTKKRYQVEFRLYKIGIDGYRTLYCLGVWPGCYVQFLGAPFTYANMTLDVEIRMKDNGSVVFQKRYNESIKYKVGLYYNWNCLKFLGMNICNVMNQFCSDVQEVQPWFRE